MRQLAEGDSELVYIDRVVDVRAAGRQAYTPVLRVFRFTLRQLRVKMGSNTLKVRAGRFEELARALAQQGGVDTAFLSEFAPTRLKAAGKWPWGTADLSVWLASDDLRVLHLAAVTDNELTFTFR